MTTLVLTLEVLLARFGSKVSEVVVAVLVITVPSAVLALTWKVSVTPKLAPTVRTPVLQTTTAPRLQPLDGSPASKLWSTKVMPAGTVSVRTTF